MYSGWCGQLPPFLPTLCCFASAVQNVMGGKSSCKAAAALSLPSAELPSLRWGSGLESSGDKELEQSHCQSPTLSYFSLLPFPLGRDGISDISICLFYVFCFPFLWKMIPEWKVCQALEFSKSLCGINFMPWGGSRHLKNHYLIKLLL